MNINVFLKSGILSETRLTSSRRMRIHHVECSSSDVYFGVLSIAFGFKVTYCGEVARRE